MSVTAQPIAAAISARPKVRGHIAIIGDGIAGCTLHAQLARQGIASDLFGVEHHNRCGIRGCGYGISRACYDLMVALELHRADIFLGYRNTLFMDGRPMRGTLYSFDKAAFLRSLSADVRYDQPSLGAYDLVINATGLGSGRSLSDKIAYNYQCRVRLPHPAEAAFDMIRGGYLWTIPLTGNEAHIGGGSTVVPIDRVTGMVKARIQHAGGDIVCACAEPIRLSGPTIPLVAGNTVRVGEAAGLVVPFGGGGIHPALESAVMLAGCLYSEGLDNGIIAYDNMVSDRFGWLATSRRLLDHLEHGRVPVRYLPTAYKALRYQGLRPTPADLWYIRKRIMEANSNTDARLPRS